MADLLAGIDFAADFERWAQGLAPVGVAQIHPDTGEVLGSVDDVPAAKLLRRRAPFAVSGGAELTGEGTEFVLSAARVPWGLKARDQITDASGNVWIVTGVALEALDALCRASVTSQPE